MIRMPVKKKNYLRSLLFVNVSYKLVALFISFVLWISILSRRDFVVTEEINVKFSTAAHHVISAQSAQKVRIRISGQQQSMKKHKDYLQDLNFDVSNKKVGTYDVDILPYRFELPHGIRILSIKPNFIKYEIVEKDVSPQQGLEK